MDEFIDQKKLKLKEILSKDRFQHSKSVAVVAEKLALRYGVSTKKAVTAALLHDCSKGLSDGQYFEYLKQVPGYESMNEVHFNREKYNSLHALVSVVFAKEYFEIEDIDTLEAIKHHTNGASKMTLLGKIIYIADVIEPLRAESDDLKKIRKILESEGINQAIVYEIKCKLKNLLKRDRKISYELIGMYNSIIHEMEDEK